MWFGIITLFPEMFAALNFGVLGRAISEDLITLNYWNPRDFANNKHRNVDDRPYGGGPGMIMMPEPLKNSIHAAKKAAPSEATVIYLSPQGRKLDQTGLNELLNKKNLILISGRYEGIDERIITSEIQEEWSIGDYVLSGGELAAMVLIDAVTRLIPGALGHEESATLDSLSSGLLKYPQYTRPEIFEEAMVPRVLLEGDHKAIERWRLKQSLGITWLKRPDLIAKRDLQKHEQELLTEFVEEHKNE